MARYAGGNVALCMLALHEVDDMDTDDVNIFKNKSVVATRSRLMDFYNNALGVRIGLNFKGSERELIKYIHQRIYQGSFVVLGNNNELMFPFR